MDTVFDVDTQFSRQALAFVDERYHLLSLNAQPSLLPFVDECFFVEALE